MPRMIGAGLSRREREILDILHRRGRATAAEILAALSDSPSYSAVRSVLRILVAKGHARHEEEGKRYVYLPTQPRPAAAQSALRGVLQTFFGGSLTDAVKTFLSDTDARLTEEELSELAALIEQTRIAGLREGNGDA
ncbi:MAG: BlaI/MecI/CopY family transcriptional regulator [Armatimonadota bacterium]|nr:BlaI/MecI/CopY family transcriptional regulator [Armatimonadota bacterium]